MKTIRTSAPGKIILFGEHAVVYDKLGIACTINKRCVIEVSSINREEIFLENKGINLNRSFKKEEIFDLFEKVDNARKNNEFNKVKEIFGKDKFSSGLFVIASIFKKYKFRGLRIKIESNIPKGLGSSSAIFSALTLGISKFLGENLSKKEISDFAFLGDLMAHGGTPSGIDNSTVTYGGYLKYRKSEGVIPLDINFKIPLIVVNSGEPAKTGDTVSSIREQREKNPEFVNGILDSLDSISEKSLEFLMSQDFERLGDLMLEYYQELKKLNISTSKLDRIIDIAIENKALGAKPTGGWGGGCCLVLARDQKEIDNLIKKFKENNFDSFQGEIGVEGVKELL